MKIGTVLFLGLIASGLTGCGSNSHPVDQTYTQQQLDDCQDNLKRLSAVLRMYNADNNDRMPFTNRWNNLFQTYLRTDRYFICPVVIPEIPSYGIIAKLEGHPLSEISDWGAQISFFEINGGANFAGGSSDLVSHPRHFNGDNFAFIDGRVRWYPRDFAAGLGWDRISP